MDLSTTKRTLKRPRPVQSCVNCRSKKLKCDRKTPCEKCVKQGLADQCVFDAQIGSLSHQFEPSTTTRQSSADVGSTTAVPPAKRQKTISLEQFESLEARVRKIEGLLLAANRNDGPPVDEAESADCSAPSEHSEDVVASHISAQPRKPLDSFHTAKSFIRDKVADPENMRRLKEIRRLFPANKPGREKQAEIQADLGHKMIEILPLKSACDVHVETFFKGLQALHPIFEHVMFMEDYRLYWSLSLPERAKSTLTPCLLLITVLSSITTVVPIQPEPETACDLVNEWISSLTKKLSHKLTTLQIQTLLILVTQFKAISQPDRMWFATGNLVRSAMASGLHERCAKVDEKRNTTIIQAKLWATIIELDLQSSLVRGLPPALSEHDYHPHDYSAMEIHSLHYMLQNTLPIRLGSTRLINQTNLDTTSIVAKLAAFKSIQEKSALSADLGLYQALFNTYVHRSIAALLRPSLRASTKVHGAHMTILFSSLKVLDHLKTLRGVALQVFFRLCSQTILQALQIICLVLRYRPSRSSETLIRGGPRSLASPANLASAVEETLNILISETSINDIESFLKDLVALAVILASTRSHDKTTTRAAMEAAFEDALEKLSQRGGEAQNHVQYSLNRTASVSSMTSSNNDFGLTFDGQLDFDFGAAFDQPYEFDLNDFSFDIDAPWTTP